MAQNQTEKRRALARAFIAAARTFTDGAYEANRIYDEAVACGVVFMQADFDNLGDLEHLTPDVLTDAGTALHNVVTTAETSGDFQKVLLSLR